ncbi:MAG: hypothetical protein Q7T48_22000 [Cellvibrio sp.]|uniref:hypothetical protein n=1 Tax=Cellvibrio sp. TaxID=1965322 RepID=UPI0027185A31|nr:hypothetical protein [Cellvibrio sp.]
MTRLKSWLFALIQFLPLSSFASFAFWNGVPTSERWIQAFEYGTVAGLIQLMIIFFQPNPVNRLILGANLYLIVGGLAAFFQQWWLFKLYGSLQESAIFIFIFCVGLVSTFATTAGFLSVQTDAKERVRNYSYCLLAATAIALVCSLLFQGNKALSVVIPIIVLALLQRYFTYKLKQFGN